MKSKTRKHKRKYTAIIIEPRKHKALSFVLKNFLTNLNNDWSIIIFHGNLNKEYVKDIINNDLSKYKDRITLKSINKDNIYTSEYSKLLVSKDFYEYIPTETFLIFQTDTMIIPKNKDNIYDFLEYDYVGAPFPFTHYVGNGGLSLRKKSKMLEIIDKIPYFSLSNIKSSHYIDLEDLYFSLSYHYHLFSYLNNVKINKPTSEKATLFSSDYYVNPKSFGIHGVWKYTDINTLKKIYPDIETLVNLQDIEK